MQTRHSCKVILTFLTTLVSLTTRAQTFKATDLSVLWPLKASADRDPVFLKSGDGFCNAPALSEGSIFPKDMFEKFSAIAFNASNNECQRDTSLENQFFFIPDEETLKQDIHLALLKGISPAACNYTSWRVTGMRFDPCRPGSKCNHVVRLVAQPFEKQTNGLWSVRDFTIHLVYMINDVSSFISDLKATASVARQVESKEVWDSVWDSVPQVLRPHHALRNELNSCNGTYSTAIRNLLKKWTTKSNLFMVGWMTSSFGMKEWTFGEVQVSNNGLNFTAGRHFGRSFSNFSDSLMQEGKPATSAAATESSAVNLNKQLALAALPALPADESSTAKRTSHIDAVQRILDPKKTSQSQGDCVACHLAPQTLERLRTLYQSPAAVGSGEFKALVWPGFLREPRSFAQLRNFGYGPQFQMAVNRRTINETQDIFDMMPQFENK